METYNVSGIAREKKKAAVIAMIDFEAKDRAEKQREIEEERQENECRAAIIMQDKASQASSRTLRGPPKMPEAALQKSAVP